MVARDDVELSLTTTRGDIGMEGDHGLTGSATQHVGCEPVGKCIVSGVACTIVVLGNGTEDVFKCPALGGLDGDLGISAIFGD